MKENFERAFVAVMEAIPFLLFVGFLATVLGLVVYAGKNKLDQYDKAQSIEDCIQSQKARFHPVEEVTFGLRKASIFQDKRSKEKYLVIEDHPHGIAITKYFESPSMNDSLKLYIWTDTPRTVIVIAKSLYDAYKQVEPVLTESEMERVRIDQAKTYELTDKMREVLD